jgi:hypothetical protein
MPRTIPSIASHITSDLITAADYNNGPAASNTFLTTVPIFMGYSSAGQTLTNNVAAAIALDAELVDSDNGHSLVTNNSRYTAQVTGWYAVSGVVSFAANATNVRLSCIRTNGSVFPGAVAEWPAASAGVTCVPTNVTLVPLAVNDYVELVGFQNSGGSLALASGTQTSTGMSVWWVSSV